MTASPYTFKKSDDRWMRRRIPNGKWQMLHVQKDDMYRPSGRNGRNRKGSTNESPENNRYRAKDKWEWL